MSNLENLSKEALIGMVKELQLAITSMHSVAKKNTYYHNHVKPHFSFSSFKQRKVAMHLSYIGHSYQGLASQGASAINTIEDHLFKALISSKLIESVESCKYSRCGRTDKGVSAFKQVISLHIRSCERIDNNTTNRQAQLSVDGPAQGFTNESIQLATLARKDELPYLAIINSILPADIRVLGWTDVDTDFDARFDCDSRTYHYYFLAEDLDIQKMQDAALLFLGTHNFKNFCKVDHARQEIRYERTIIDSRIQRIDTEKEVAEYVYIVTGKGFLYHQVRCMVSILFLVGRQLEDPSIIEYLFTCMEKPTYHMADERNLVLWDCSFSNPQFTKEMYADPKNSTLKNFYKNFSDTWVSYSLSQAYCQQYLKLLGGDNGTNQFLSQALQRCSHTPIRKRKQASNLVICGEHGVYFNIAMGFPLRKYIDSCYVYQCNGCSTHFSTPSDIVSRSFTGTFGKGYLFRKVLNIFCGPAESRKLLTGIHVVSDVFCKGCQALIGWKYIYAEDPSQRYKIDMVVLEHALFKLFRQPYITDDSDSQSESVYMEYGDSDEYSGEEEYSGSRF